MDHTPQRLGAKSPQKRLQQRLLMLLRKRSVAKNLQREKKEAKKRQKETTTWEAFGFRWCAAIRSSFCPFFKMRSTLSRWSRTESSKDSDNGASKQKMRGIEFPPKE